ncbi:MFS transporter [Kocuria sp. CPCC 204721]|uniref:MFS transporter n=1 Tax=Kocuria sp. CPCC 204721 TaxID=3073548 RepID=UPI0034D5EA53
MSGSRGNGTTSLIQRLSCPARPKVPRSIPRPENTTPRKACKALIGAYVGTSLEWYDFFLFGPTASIVFAPLFFGGEDPALAVLRFLQGMAVRGEWGGATLLAVENAPEHKRGFSSAVVQLGSPTGTILSSMIVAAVAAVVALADKTSPSIVEAVGYANAALVAFPIFWLVDTRDTALITVAMILGLGFASIPYAPVGTVLTQLFPVKVR